MLGVDGNIGKYAMLGVVEFCSILLRNMVSDFDSDLFLFEDSFNAFFKY